MPKVDIILLLGDSFVFVFVWFFFFYDAGLPHSNTEKKMYLRISTLSMTSACKIAETLSTVSSLIVNVANLVRTAPAFMGLLKSFPYFKP